MAKKPKPSIPASRALVPHPNFPFVRKIKDARSRRLRAFFAQLGKNTYRRVRSTPSINAQIIDSVTGKEIPRTKYPSFNQRVQQRFKNLKTNIKSGRAGRYARMSFGRAGAKAGNAAIKGILSLERPKSRFVAGALIGGGIFAAADDYLQYKNKQGGKGFRGPRWAKAQGSRLKRLGDAVIFGAASGAGAAIFPIQMMGAGMAFGAASGASIVGKLRRNRMEKAGYFKHQKKLQKNRKIKREQKETEKVRRIIKETVRGVA